MRRSADATEVERSLLAALAAAWSRLNHAPFGGTLRPPTFAFGDGASRHGCWRVHERIIELSRASIRELPWGAVVEVLRHEMAHQYVDEVLGQRDESAHGALFRRVCRQFGAAASASASPASMSLEDDPILRKVRKLLALAGSPNAQEAEAAMQAARRLMARHGVSPEEPGEEMAVGWVGPVTGRTAMWRKILGGLLAQHFAVSGIYIPAWDAQTGKAGSQLEIGGRPADVEMATWVYAFLEHTAERLWSAHRTASATPGDRDRQRFLAGVMLGFRDKLRSQDVSFREQGLVIAVGAPARDFFRRRYPRVTHRGGGSLERSQALHAGRAAGREIVLSRPLGSDAGNVGRRLPAGRGSTQ